MTTVRGQKGILVVRRIYGNFSLSIRELKGENLSFRGYSSDRLEFRLENCLIST